MPLPAGVAKLLAGAARSRRGKRGNTSTATRVAYAVADDEDPIDYRRIAIDSAYETIPEADKIMNSIANSAKLAMPFDTGRLRRSVYGRAGNIPFTHGSIVESGDILQICHFSLGVGVDYAIYVPGVEATIQVNFAQASSAITIIYARIYSSNVAIAQANRGG